MKKYETPKVKILSSIDIITMSPMVELETEYVYDGDDWL